MRRTTPMNKSLKPFLAEQYKNLPESRYITLFIVRTTQSEAIFRTEGSGEGCNRELVSDADGAPVYRVVISKRKQTAVERREGRQILRHHNLLFSNTDKITEDAICSMNRQNPCEKCIDCKLYGFAVGTGGAQRSRVITDDAYSLLPYEEITDKKTFNAPYETGTMKDPVTGQSSRSIGEDEYIIPGAHFLDIEVLRDVTAEELTYAVANVLRSKRYGAITSRIGSVQNTIVDIVGSDTELFSTLEWVNTTAADLKSEKIQHPQPIAAVTQSARKAIPALLENVCGVHYRLTDVELAETMESVKTLYASPDELTNFLKKITLSYPGNEGLLS